MISLLRFPASLCRGVLIFFLAQRVFIEGITLTGVKG